MNPSVTPGTGGFNLSFSIGRQRRGTSVVRLGTLLVATSIEWGGNSTGGQDVRTAVAFEKNEAISVLESAKVRYLV